MPKTWKLIALVLAGILVLAPRPAAQEAGACAFEFARLAAEPIGRTLGAAHVAAVVGPEATAWNPAGLGGNGGSRALISHATWMADTAWDWGALVLDLPGAAGGLGVTFGMFRAGALSGYDALGNPTGDFAPQQLLTSFGYGQALGDRLRVGIQVELAAEGISGEGLSRVWGFGAGAQLRLGRLELGAAALHLGPDVEIADEAFALPRTLRGGASLDCGAGLKLHGGLEQAAEEEMQFMAGLEWRPVGALAAFAGCRPNTAGEALATCGMALEIGRTCLAYGFQPRTELDASHQISLSVPLTRGP